MVGSILSSLPVSASIPSDVFVARRVGSSIFCTVEGRLVCLHVKTDHTFLITVTQEPLVLHLGTFRFKALSGGRGEGASVAAYAKAFIEAFEHTSHVGDATQRSNSNNISSQQQPPALDVLGVHLLLNGQTEQASAHFSPEGSVLGSPRATAAGPQVDDDSSAALSAAAAATRRSSLVTLHREKMDLEMKQLGSPLGGAACSPTASGGGLRSPLKWGQRSESVSSPAGAVATTTLLLRSDEELRNDATVQQTLGIVVTFSVFGTPHSVVLHLKTCPPEPDVREHVIWGIFMDLYRSVSEHRSHAQRLEVHAQRHQVERAAFAKQHNAEHRQQHGQQLSGDANRNSFSTTSTTPQAGSLQRPAGSASMSSRGGSAAGRRPGSSALGNAHGEQPFRKLFASTQQEVANDASSTLLPSVVAASFAAISGGVSGAVGPGGGTAAPHRSSSSKCMVPPPPPPTTPPHHSQKANVSMPPTVSSWSYSGKCAYLESTRTVPGCIATNNNDPASPRQRPTSARSDFTFRQEYVREVQARGGGTPVAAVDQSRLLYPTAPPSATNIRGTYSGRSVLKNVATVDIQLAV
jgi:hypothetical protein